MSDRNTDADKGLAPFRAELDEIDAQLLDTLRARLECCSRIAEYKLAHDIPMMQSHRIAQVQDRAVKYAEQHGMNREFAREVYRLLIDEACRAEDAIIAAGRAASRH